MAGGAGFDTFIYTLASDSTGAAMDVIFGFETGGDKIRLSAIDADTTMAGNQAFHMVSPGTIFASAGDLAIERSGFDSYIRGDLNGDSVWDLEIKVALNTTISAADIILGYRRNAERTAARAHRAAVTRARPGSTLPA